MTMNNNLFIKLEAWICDSGDGSAHIQWFLPEKAPNEQDPDFDYESYGMNEGSGITVEVRRGGSEHKQAYINAHGRENFFQKDDPASDRLKELNWIEVEHWGTHIEFKPPEGWENT